MTPGETNSKRPLRIFGPKTENLQQKHDTDRYGGWDHQAGRMAVPRQLTVGHGTCISTSGTAKFNTVPPFENAADWAERMEN